MLPPVVAIHPVRTLRSKTFILLFLMMFAGSIGNIILDKGMKDIGGLDFSTVEAARMGFLLVIASPMIWLGSGCLALYLVCNMLVLSLADYSFVMPFGAIGYALVPLMGYLWLHEQVPVTRWAGIGLILFGVFLISRTPHSTITAEAEGPSLSHR